MTHFEYARNRFARRLTSGRFGANRTGQLAMDCSASPGPSADRATVIYVVDDLSGLTELYASLLTELGYEVRAFNDRSRALAMLKKNRAPGLLITDYVGSSLPIRRFIQECRRIHPGIRILMASGLDPAQMQLCVSRPDRFLQKPFTVQELQSTIRAMLMEEPGP